MLGISFKNPNYENVVNGKTRFVDNDLEMLSTAKEYCAIRYSGFAFGNAVITVGSYRVQEKATALLPVSDLCLINMLFRKGELVKHEVRGKLFNKEDEFVFDVEKTPKGFQIGIANGGPTLAMNFSEERFKYLLDRMMLGYFQFLASELSNKGSLKPGDQEIHDKYKLNVDTLLQLGKYPNQKPYQEDKTVFSATDNLGSTFNLCMNSYGIKKAKLVFASGENNLSCYVSFEDILLIAQDIKTGKYFKLFGRTKGKPLFEKIGGTHSTTEKPVRTDGMPEARVFSVVSGTTQDEIVLCLAVGQGQKTDNGGIQMKQIEHQVRVSLTEKQAKSLSCCINKSVFAYLIEAFSEDVKKEPLNQKLGPITRVNASKTMLVPVSRAFNMKKFRLDFSEYDKKTRKQVKYVDFYVSEEMFFSLYEKVLSGELYKLSKQESLRVAQEEARTSKKVWPKPIFTCSAGTAPENAGRTDKSALAKVLNVFPGLNGGFTLQGVSGCGTQDEEKRIKMKKPETYVYVALDADSMKKTVLILMMYWKAFKVAQNIALEKEQLVHDNKQSEQVG